MPADPADALVDAADDGVDFDGLTAGVREGAYRLSVPGETHADLSEAAFREAASRHRAYVEEWYFWRRCAPESPDRRAFLRWLERADERAVPDRRAALADGLSRTWGQLRVRVGASAEGSGRRSYEVRHEADAGEALAELATYSDPTDVRAVARHDDRGRYRPLSTAPTLRSDWAFVDLDAADVTETVDRFYPATIANWYREREGDLDVTHWREVAGRQTGIYDVVDELRGRQVGWLAEACCVDSQCLKRRAWDESEDEPVDVPRGEGEFPCREPCSLVVAAAREFALAEREEEGHVELGLSEREHAQIERLLQAVADGELAGVHDGDVGDGANRYRVRYLRAKLAAIGTSGSDAGSDE